MAAQDQIKKLNDQIQELNKQLGGEQIKIFDVNELNEAQSVLSGLRSEINNITTDIGGIASGFKSVVQEMSKSSVPLNDAKKSFRSLSSLAQNLKNDQEGISKLNLKDLTSLKEKIKKERANLKTTKDTLLAKKSSVGLSNAEEASLTEINGVLQGNDGLYRGLLTTANSRLAKEEKITEAIGLGGQAVEGIGKALDKMGFDGLTGKLGLEEAQEKMKEVADEVTNGGENTADFAGKMKVLKAGISSMGNSLISNLKDPLTIGVFLVNELFQALKGADEATGNLAKNMNMTYSEASQMRMELNTSSNLSGDIFVNTKGMQESLMAINGTLGTNVMLNKENLVTFTKLREAAGFTNEELMGMQSLANATGGDLESMTGEFLAQSRITATQNKAVLNEKQLMKEISQVSAATTLSFGKNPSLIAEAVTTAKALGMEMSKVESIADSLLQFESSIENELQAELLLGKNINLEKARQAALNNDLKTVAEEIAKQAGSSEEFAKMNRIQQEALASAVGMGREELAKSLFLQEQIGNVSAEEYNLRKKQVEELEAKGLSQSQIKEKLAKTSIEDLQNQASVQDRLNKSVEKLREVFVSIADPIMQIVSPIIDLLIPALEGISFILTPLFTAFQGMSKILTGSFETLTGWQAVLGSIAVIYASVVGYQKISKAFSVAELALKESIIIQEIIQEGLEKRSLRFGKSKIIQLAAQAALWALANPIKALLGIAAAATVGAVAYKYMKVGDINSPAKGKTQVSTKEGGLFEASPNDDIVAAPGASAIMARATQPQQTTVVQNDNTESKRTNMLLEQILSKQGTIKLDSTDMGTAMSVNSYAIQ